MARAKEDGSKEALDFIKRETDNEFASLREMKVILKELKDKVQLEDSLSMEVAIQQYEVKNGELSTDKVVDFPKDAYKKD
jgi:hypothetical protein